MAQLIRFSNRPEVYDISGGELQHVDAAEFARRGSPWGQVQVLQPPTSPYRTPDDPNRVYLDVQGQQVHIPDPQTFTTLGLDWGAVTTRGGTPAPRTLPSDTTTGTPPSIDYSSLEGKTVRFNSPSNGRETSDRVTEGKVRDAGTGEMVSVSSAGNLQVYDSVNNAWTPVLQPSQTKTQIDPGTGDLFDVVKQMLQSMLASGQTINPNKEVTPQDAADFLAHLQQNTSAFLPEAQRQIAPYYQAQLKQAQDQLQRDFGLVPQQYAQDVRSLGQQFAEQGLALSGRRLEAEQNLTGRYQQSAANTAAQFAQQYGTVNLPTAPTLQTPEAPTVGSRTLPLYSLDPNVYANLQGTQQFQQESDVQRRARELEASYRQYSQPMTRQLTF